LLIGGISPRKRRPNCEWRMRSGSAAIAKNGKIDVAPITWKTPCASASKKTPASFALPYGRARKRTRRIRLETFWTNRGMFPNYTFKKLGDIASRNGENSQLSAEKLKVSKVARISRRESHGLLQSLAQI